MADILLLAQDLYDEATEDGSLLSEYKDDRRAILVGIRKRTSVGDVISGTKNGASYTKRIGFTLEDIKNSLTHAIIGIESGVRPGHTSRISFNC